MTVLIAPKHVTEFTPDEYYTYVNEMYSLRTKGKAKSASPAPGLTVSRTKKGALSIRLSKAKRAFAYVTFPELAALALAAQCSQSELWQAFNAKKFIVAQTRMLAEERYAALKETSI